MQSFILTLVARLLLLLCFIQIILLSHTTVTQAKSNKSKKENFKFRMEKLNFVWAKAEHQLADQLERLRKLQADLATFDLLYLGLKQDAHHKGKELEPREVDRIDSKLEKLLERYDLDDAILAFRMKYKYDKTRLYSLTEGESSAESDSKSKRMGGDSSAADTSTLPFEDPRLVKLWNEAKSDSAFPLEDLDDLYYELEQHERKLDDYRQMLQHAEEIAQNHLRADTTQHHQKNDAASALEREQEADSIASMKQIGKSLDKDLERIERRVTETRQHPFKVKRVKQLWSRALKASSALIPNELDAIKAELKHFERHWQKAQHHQEHMGRAREMEEELSPGGRDSSEDGGWVAEMERMQDKLEQKLLKLEAYLDEKIAESTAKATEHSEL